MRLLAASSSPTTGWSWRPGIRFVYGQPEGYDQAAAQRMPHAWEAGAQTALLAAQLRAVPDGRHGRDQRASGTHALPARALRARQPHCLLAEERTAALQGTDLRFQQPLSAPGRVHGRPGTSSIAGMIEWIPPTQGGAVTRVDVAARTLTATRGAHRVAVANIDPAAGARALAAQTRPCLRSWLVPGQIRSPSNRRSCQRVHVIGDACIAGDMPKAASAARSQAQQCAAAICAAAAAAPGSGHGTGECVL